MNVSFTWKHIAAAILVAVAAYLTGQNGGLAGILQAVGDSVSTVVGTSSTGN